MKITHPHDEVWRRLGDRFWGSIGDKEDLWGRFWDRFSSVFLDRFWEWFEDQDEVTK